MSNNKNHVILNQNELTQIKDTFTKLKRVCRTDIMKKKYQLHNDNSITFYKKMYEYAVLWNSSLFCFIMFMLIILPYQHLKNRECLGNNFNEKMTTAEWFKKNYTNFSQKIFKTLSIQDKTMVQIPLVLISSSLFNTSSSLGNLFKKVMMNSFRNTDSNHQFADLSEAIEQIAANEKTFNSELNWDKLSNSNKKFLAHLSGKAINDFRFYHTNVKNKKKWIECVENETNGLEFRRKMVKYLHPLGKAFTFYGNANSKFPGLAFDPISMIKKHLSITGDSISLAELVQKIDHDKTLIVSKVSREINKLRKRYDVLPYAYAFLDNDMIDMMINSVFTNDRKRTKVKEIFKKSEMLNVNIVNFFNGTVSATELNNFKNRLDELNENDLNKIIIWMTKNLKESNDLFILTNNSRKRVAATKIQAATRGKINRNARKRAAAATKIQAVTRGKLNRKLVGNMVEFKETERKLFITEQIDKVIQGVKCVSTRQTECSHPECNLKFPVVTGMDPRKFVTKVKELAADYVNNYEPNTVSRSHCRICCNAFCPKHIIKNNYIVKSQNNKTPKEIPLCEKCKTEAIHFNLLEKVSRGGGKKKSKKPVKKVRKHQGIYQKGPKKGRLKPGFKYSGKKTKTGLKVIIKVKK